MSCGMKTRLSTMALSVPVLASLSEACANGLWYDVEYHSVEVPAVCKTGLLPGVGAGLSAAAGMDMPDMPGMSPGMMPGDIWIGEENVDWRTASEFCVSKGASLVSIHSASENEKVKALCGDKSCWIGLYEKTPGPQSDEDWQWMDGTSYDYKNWNPGEPNNHNGVDENVAVMNSCAFGLMGLIGLVIYLLVCVVVPLSLGVGQLCAWVYAHMARETMLTKARQNQRVEPPSPYWKYCCGAAAVYYWEGCSTNYFITCCLWQWFSICCWNPTPFPMENGMMVGQATQVGYGSYGGYGGGGYTGGAVVVGQVVGNNDTGK